MPLAFAQATLAVHSRCSSHVTTWRLKGTIEIVQAPDAMCAQTTLGALAYAAQSRIDVKLPTESVRPVSLFLGTLGKSGERKFEVDGRLTWPRLGLRAPPRSHEHQPHERKHR
jgi:hypothetical protein